MKSKRNGLLEIYRFIICFWPLYYHNFFFWPRDNKTFTVAELSVDFFFILSGFFLMRIMRREKETPVFQGAWRIMFSRVKPMIFTMCFIAAFNFICVALFIKEDYYNTIHLCFMYWWYVLFLTIAIGVFYLVYRLLKSEKRFVAFLVVLIITMALVQYGAVEHGMFFQKIVFFARTLACIPVGILLSYIPPIKSKGFNINIIFVAILILTLLYMAYNEKTFLIRIVMIAMFGALVYFSSNVSFGGKVCDFLGQLSMRIYLYMGFVTMLYLLGLTNNKVLFVIEVALAVMDTLFGIYRQKYKQLKAKKET